MLLKATFKRSNLDGNLCPTLTAHSEPLPFSELAETGSRQIIHISIRVLGWSPTKNGIIALRSATNGSIPNFYYCLVVNRQLLRLLSSHTLVSYWPEFNLNIKVTKILYHCFLLLDWFRFWETHFTTYQRFVADQSVIISSLGGWRNRGIFAKKIWKPPGQKNWKKNLVKKTG